ncbi:MAG: hypothetical protein EXX96DRAFT_391317 [Benjaminiella poitrasii]|nr:MAG: hypothetical protein EXX96DRAFT_391317 [Benjaminiella poitrasii]
MELSGYLNNSTSTYNWRIRNWSSILKYVTFDSPYFYFQNLRWILSINKGTNRHRNYLSFYLYLITSVSIVKKLISYGILFKNLSSYVQRPVELEFNSCLFISDGTSYGSSSAFKLSEIESLVSKDGELSIILTMKLPEEENSGYECVAPYMSFFQYIGSNKFSDVSFRVFEHEKYEEDTHNDSNIIHAHKIILAAVSPWFSRLFGNGMRETSEQVIDIYGVQLNIFQRLISYCYEQELKLIDLKDMYNVLEAADRFEFPKICQEVFYAIRQEINVQNVWEILELSEKYDNERTVDACIRYIDTHMKFVFQSDVFLKAKAAHIRMAFTMMKWIKNREIEIEKCENVLVDVLDCLDFSRLPLDYLENKVETDAFNMRFEAFRRKLTEGYKYYAKSRVIHK